MASEPRLIAFPSREAMAARLADVAALALERGVCADGRGEIAVSGGSTPEGLYRELASRPIDWSQCRATLVDERWVGLDHPRSNEAFIRRAFSAADALDIEGLFTGAERPADAAEALNKRFGAREKPYDIAILGMGADGHTASWFPHADGLDEALSSGADVCAIAARPSEITGAETERMTLTLSAVARARLIILVIAGDEKKTAFENAATEGPVEDCPVRAILNARPDLWVAWAP